jgi:hypothetical protein
MRANQSGDSLYRWKYNAKQNTLMVYYKDFRKKRMVQDSTYLQLSAIVSPIMLPNFINEGNGWLPAFLYWAGMVVFLLAFYFFMDFFIRKVFFLKVLDTRSIAGIDEQLLKNKSHQAHLFVVGLPQSGKSATVKKYYTDAKHGTNEFDFAQLLTIPVAAEGEDAEASPAPNEGVTAFKAYYEDDPSEAHPKFLLLHHFEFQQYDPAISLSKLEFLEEWIFKPHLRIILLSATQSLAFIEHAQRKAKGETDADVSSRNLSYRWLNVMNHFYLLYHPLQGYREISTYPLTLQYEKNTDQSSHEQVLHMLNGIIERECSHGEFLEGIKTELHTYVQKAMEQAKDEPKDKQEEYMPESLKIMLNFASDDDELILKVQSLSQNYYQSLWDALSVDERKLVYDMAQDGLVNHQNIDIINLLINKGLFVVEGSVPRMMNKSFRNFVLTQLVGEDLQEMETALSEGGTWQRLRPAIIIVLVVVAGFIFITQRETFNSMLGYLGAFAGGILALLRLFDSVAPKSGSS